MHMLIITMEGAYGMFKKSISFKDAEENLYKHLCSKFCPSAYVKELIKEDIDKENSNTEHNDNFNKGFKF